MNKKWVGIFQAEWALQCHTINIAIALAHAGFCVDLFLYKTLMLTGVEQARQTPNINLHIFEEPLSHYSGQNLIWQLIQRGHRGLKRRILEKIYEPYLFQAGDVSNFLPYFIPDQIRQQVDKIIENKDYHCLIGIEKLGLGWAGSIADKIKAPCIYQNLELYTRDHPAYDESLRIRLLKKIEEKYHKKSHATIIQDSRRAKVLLKDNDLTEANIIYLPVSLLGNTYEKPSSFIQEKFGLANSEVVILQFGLVRRFGLELTQISQEFPSEWNLVLHDGVVINHLKDYALVARLKEADINKRLKLSLDDLSSEQIKDFVASAHIGLVLYANTCENDYLTIFSSEKLALYLQCGVPVIGFNYPGYELLEQCHCGVVIQELQDLPSAIKKILDNYEIYSLNAYRTFMKYYNFEQNFDNVIRSIKQLT